MRRCNVIYIKETIEISRDDLSKELKKVRELSKDYPFEKMYYEARPGGDYYRRAPDKKYIGTAEHPDVRRISTGQFLHAVQADLEEQIGLHELFLNEFHPIDYHAILQELDPKYQNIEPDIFNKLGQPVLKLPPSGPNFKKKYKKIRASDGQMVRSKGEAMIIDIYLRHKIPYTYEPELTLPNGEYARPDFMLFTKKSQRRIIHEHLGKLGDPGYQEDFLYKMSLYLSAGLVYGYDFFLTSDDPKIGTNIPKITQLILAHVND